MVLLFLGTASASHPSQTSSEIIAKHVAARGGLEKIRSLRTIKKSGVLRSLGLEFEVTELETAPYHISFRFSNGFGETINTFDGVAPSQRVRFPTWETPSTFLAGLDGEALVVLSDFEGILVDASAKGSSIELLGRETTDQGDVYRFEVILANQEKRIVHVDVQDFLVKRIIYNGTVRNWKGAVHLLLDDHRPVQGTQINHRLEVQFNGTPIYTFVYDNVEVNPGREVGLRPLEPVPYEPLSAPPCNFREHVDAELGFSLSYCEELVPEESQEGDVLFAAASPHLLPRVDVFQIDLARETPLVEVVSRVERLLERFGEGRARVAAIKEIRLQDGVTPGWEVVTDWSYHGLPLRSLLVTTAGPGRDVQVQVTHWGSLTRDSLRTAYSLNLRHPAAK